MKAITTKICERFNSAAMHQIHTTQGNYNNKRTLLKEMLTPCIYIKNTLVPDKIECLLY